MTGVSGCFHMRNMFVNSCLAIVVSEILYQPTCNIVYISHMLGQRKTEAEHCGDGYGFRTLKYTIVVEANPNK